MNMLWAFQQLWVRYRYPVSLPADVAQALGIEISNQVTFNQLLDQLLQNSTKLQKGMPRELVEFSFKNALRKDPTGQSAFFSYYFLEGWLVFEVHFDKDSKLRRLYLQHQRIKSDKGIEIRLS